MRYLKLLIPLMLLLFLSGCDQLDELTHFNMDFEQEVVIESSVIVDLPYNVITPEINSNSESTFENNNTHKDLIEDIRLTSMVLEIKSPSNGSFNFLNSIEIFLSADDEDEVRIAWKENIPANGSKQIELEVSNDDLKSFLKKDTFSLRLETVTDELITSDHHIDVKSTFFVDAEILGI